MPVEPLAASAEDVARRRVEEIHSPGVECQVDLLSLCDPAFTVETCGEDGPRVVREQALVRGGGVGGGTNGLRDDAGRVDGEDDVRLRAQVLDDRRANAKSWCARPWAPDAED